LLLATHTLGRIARLLSGVRTSFLFSFTKRRKKPREQETRVQDSQYTSLQGVYKGGGRLLPETSNECNDEGASTSDIDDDIEENEAESSTDEKPVLSLGRGRSRLRSRYFRLHCVKYV
jgi:hypothetical protein